MFFFIKSWMFLELFLLAKIMRFLTKVRDSLYFQVFPRHFYFMRGHSLVELTQHDDSAAFILHNVYDNIWTPPPRNSGGIP